MKIISFLLLFILFLSCSPKKNVQEQIVIDRIENVYNVKTFINDSVWNDFSEKKYDLPLVYYTGSFCYIANPTHKIISEFQPELIHENGLIKIYKTSLIDSIPFHMETAIDFSEDTTLYNYNSPIMNCSSVELTMQTIPEVHSTEMWTTMILHEYFHGFQFKHPKYKEHLKNNSTGFSQDSLINIYKKNAWFQILVDKENEFLLEAISSENPLLVCQLIDSALTTRDKRRALTIENLGIDITPIESTYETMEGSARYVEYSLYHLFAKNGHELKSIETDTSFHFYESFKDFKIENEKWLYLTDKTTYYYATGFNMIRLFDKLNIEYKSRLFIEPNLTVEDLLKHYK